MAVEDALHVAVFTVLAGEVPHVDGLVTGGRENDIGVLRLEKVNRGLIESGSLGWGKAWVELTLVATAR